MMERREFFKVTAGVVVTAATQGLLAEQPELPDLPDPDYDKVVTSAFPVSEIGAEEFQVFDIHFPKGGGEAKLPGFTYIKGIKAEAVDQIGCRVSVRPLAESRMHNHLLFHTPVDGSTFIMDSLWIKCQDGVIKADGEAALTVNCWRPKVAFLGSA
jgi:hypothetical protein